MKKNITYLFALIIGIFFIGYASASAATFSDLVDNLVGGLAVSVVSLLFSAALIFFLYGVFQYMVNPTAEGKDKGKGYIIWGLIALTVMSSVYAIIKMVQNTFLG